MHSTYYTEEDFFTVNVLAFKENQDTYGVPNPFIEKNLNSKTKAFFYQERQRQLWILKKKKTAIFPTLLKFIANFIV